MQWFANKYIDFDTVVHLYPYSTQRNASLAAPAFLDAGSLKTWSEVHNTGCSCRFRNGTRLHLRYTTEVVPQPVATYTNNKLSIILPMHSSEPRFGRPCMEGVGSLMYFSGSDRTVKMRRLCRFQPVQMHQSLLQRPMPSTQSAYRHLLMHDAFHDRRLSDAKRGEQ